MDFNNINTIAWVMGNVLVAYTAIAITVFVLGYYILFDPRATTAGRLLFRFMLSLVGVISLIFVGTFVNPPVDRGWTGPPLRTSPKVRTAKLAGATLSKAA